MGLDKATRAVFACLTLSSMMSVPSVCAHGRLRGRCRRGRGDHVKGNYLCAVILYFLRGISDPLSDTSCNHHIGLKDVNSNQNNRERSLITHSSPQFSITTNSFDLVESHSVESWLGESMSSFPCLALDLSCKGFQYYVAAGAGIGILLYRNLLSSHTDATTDCMGSFFWMTLIEFNWIWICYEWMAHWFWG